MKNYLDRTLDSFGMFAYGVRFEVRVPLSIEHDMLMELSDEML